MQPFDGYICYTSLHTASCRRFFRVLSFFLRYLAVSCNGSQEIPSWIQRILFVSRGCAASCFAGYLQAVKDGQPRGNSSARSGFRSCVICHEHVISGESLTLFCSWIEFSSTDDLNRRLLVLRPFDLDLCLRTLTKQLIMSWTLPYILYQSQRWEPFDLWWTLLLFQGKDTANINNACEAIACPIFTLLGRTASNQGVYNHAL